LAKFLRLDILENLQKVLKTELSVAKSTLAKIPEKEFDTQIFDKESQIIARKSDRQKAQDAVLKITDILSAIDAALKGDSDQQYTDLEVTDQERLVGEISSNLENIGAQLQTQALEKETMQSRLAEMLDKLQEHDYKSLREAKTQIEDTKFNLVVAGNKVEQHSTELKADKKEVKRLNDVPCGDAFPMCKYIVSAKKAEKSLLEKQENLKSFKKHVSALKSELKKLVAKNVDEKLAEKSELDEKIAHLRQEIAKIELTILKSETRKKQLENRKSDAQALLDTMKMNMCDEETAVQRKALVEKRKKADKKLQEAQRKIQFLSEKIGLLTAEVAQLGKDKKTYEENNFHHNAINLLHKSLGRDGIPLQIVKKKLPIINHEIANILTGVTGFTVELESDDKGMDIILDYGDSRRVIEVCSGMEKMMASLAIRTALIRVSSLPKSDMLIIDEGFGALDASNIEACTSLLRSLTKTFRSIIIISHVDTVKDVVDNVIEISTDNRHDSKVAFL
jgi:exonuclease SbcC